MNRKYFSHRQPITLESGAVLPEVTIAYHTFGRLAPQADNVIWVCHALTANSDVADWWPHTVETGCFLDPERYFIVCANFLGSPYGTTSPVSLNPQTGIPYFADFPTFTVRDMITCHRLLADQLGIKRVKLLIGSSIGGFQALEWSVIQPDFAERLCLIATCAVTRPWAVAFNESQRMAIRCDPTFSQPNLQAGSEGLAVARSIALLSYRGQKAYDSTQCDQAVDAKLSDYRASSYQRYQGEKLRRRFNAYSYYRLTQCIDSHNIARGRGTVSEALSGIRARTLVVAITSDILFPVDDNREIAQNIPGSQFRLIRSEFGHDGFLVEHEKLNRIICRFLQ